MAISRHVRLILLVGSLPCLLLAFFPYYSHTSGPAVLPGLSTMELPLIGTLPEQSSKTVFRVGLPFSPLLTYHKEVTFESKPTSAPTSTIDRSLKVDSDDAASNSEAKTFNFSGTIGHPQEWRFGYFSWSVAFAVLGVGLLIVSFWNRGSHPRTSPDVTSGPNA